MRIIFVKVFIVLVLLAGANLVRAQVSEDLYLYIDQIPVPPVSCKDAKDFIIGDYGNERFSLQVDTLEHLFEKMYTNLSAKSENIREKLRIRMENDDNGQSNRRMPPNGIPQGDMKDVMSDFRKTDLLQVKIEEEEEKFRSDLQSRQNSVNSELKKTLLDDREGREKIVNEFLKSVNEIYNNFTFQLKQDFKELDEITKKYDYGEDKERLLLKKKIIDIQLLEDKNLRLLISCVKGSIQIGSRFYINK